MKPKATNVIANEDYTLIVEFDNSEKKIFDVKPYFENKAFAIIKDNISEFKKVKIGELSIEWECGVDICPDELYNLSK